MPNQNDEVKSVKSQKSGMSISLCTAITVSLLASCGVHSVTVSNETNSMVSSQSNQIITQYESSIGEFELGLSEETLLKKLHGKQYETKDDGNYDSKHYYMEDLSVEVSNGKVECVAIFSDKYPTSAGIRVGDTASKIIQYYGENFDKGEVYIYSNALWYYDGQVYIFFNFNFEANDLKSDMDRKIISWGIQTYSIYDRFDDKDSEV